MYYLCSNSLSIAIIKTMTKATRGEKDFFGLHFITEWSQGRNSNTFRTWRQELKQGLWRHSANWLVQFAFLYKLGSPAQVWYCPQGPPLSIIVQDNTPIDLPQTGQSGGGIFSTEILSSLMNLRWVKLTKRTLTRQIMCIIIITLSINYIFYVISLF